MVLWASPRMHCQLRDWGRQLSMHFPAGPKRRSTNRQKQIQAAMLHRKGNSGVPTPYTSPSPLTSLALIRCFGGSWDFNYSLLRDRSTKQIDLVHAESWGNSWETCSGLSFIMGPHLETVLLYLCTQESLWQTRGILYCARDQTQFFTCRSLSTVLSLQPLLCWLSHLPWICFMVPTLSRVTNK